MALALYVSQFEEIFKDGPLRPAKTGLLSMAAGAAISTLAALWLTHSARAKISFVLIIILFLAGTVVFASGITIFITAHRRSQASLVLTLSWSNILAMGALYLPYVGSFWCPLIMWGWVTGITVIVYGDKRLALRKENEEQDLPEYARTAAAQFLPTFDKPR